MTTPLTVGLSFHVSSIFLWSFHMWYKVMSSTCYIFLPLFLFHWFSHVDTKFTFNSGTYVLLLLVKCLPSNTTKRSLVKIVEHKLKEAFSDAIWDVHLGRFLLLSVPISHQLPRHTFFFFSFLNWSLRHDCTCPLQHSGVSEQFFFPGSWEAGTYSLASNKLQCTLRAIFIRVLCTLTFVASIESPDSTTLTSKNSYYTTFYLCSSSRFG